MYGMFGRTGYNARREDDARRCLQEHGLYGILSQFDLRIRTEIRARLSLLFVPVVIHRRCDRQPGAAGYVDAAPPVEPRQFQLKQPSLYARKRKREAQRPGFLGNGLRRYPQSECFPCKGERIECAQRRETGTIHCRSQSVEGTLLFRPDKELRRSAAYR